MAPSFRSTLQDHRRSRGWSQEDLARRAGVSRAEVSGIETGRLVPSAQVALSVAAVFRCRVEDLFHLGAPGSADPVGAWPPPREPCRVWRAAVGDRSLLYPVEPTALGVLARDGSYRGRRFEPAGEPDPANTLVLAGCDPAVRLLESELARASPFRLLAFTRSSLAALELLRDGLVHVAGIHLGDGTSHGGNE